MRAPRPEHDQVRQVEPISRMLQSQGAKARPRLLHNGLNSKGGKNSKGSAKKPKVLKQTPEIGGVTFQLNRIVNGLLGG